MKTLNELEDELFLSDKYDDIENIKPEDYNEILNGVNEILSNDPSNIDALKFKCHVLYCQQNYKESIETCDLVLRKCPEDIYTLKEKEACLFQLSKYKECIDIYQQILRIDPKDKYVIESWNTTYLMADDNTLPKPPKSIIRKLLEWAFTILIFAGIIYFILTLTQ